MRNKEKTSALTAMLLVCALLPLQEVSAHDHWDDHDRQHGYGGPSSGDHGWSGGWRGPQWHDGSRYQNHHDHHDHYGYWHNRPRGGYRDFYYHGHHFRQGGRVPRDYYRDQYWVNDWRGCGLQAPPSGHRWANIDGNYVLIAIASGVITSLILNH